MHMPTGHKYHMDTGRRQHEIQTEKRQTDGLSIGQRHDKISIENARTHYSE